MFEEMFQEAFANFSSFFGSDVEMVFYVAIFIAFHVIMVHLFYKRSSRGAYRRLTVKRSLLIGMTVAEIVIFTNLLTYDHFAHALEPPHYANHVHAAMYSAR